MLLPKNDLTSFVHKHLLPLCTEHHIFTFTGPLGAGKTTLIRELLIQQGIQEPITSPTFGYLKSYQAPNNIVHHHFDLYRITSLEEFTTAGFDECILQPQSMSYIEWPTIIDPFLTQPKIASTVVHVYLAYDQTDQHMRKVKITMNKK